MSSIVTLNGIPYSIPDTGDTGWGVSVSNYLKALGNNGVLQLNGGDFPLLHEVNFGPTYGVASPYFKSGLASASDVGVLRLGNAEKVAWRNSTDTGNITLGLVGDSLYFNGVPVGGGGTTIPLTTKGDVLTYTTGPARLPVGADNQVLTADSTQASGLRWAPTTGNGTVTNFTFTNGAGVTGNVTNSSTTPNLALTLGAITPSSVAATGTVTGSNLSGTNTGNQTITLTGDVTGSGTGTFAATLATVPIAKGGTGATTQAGAINALLPNQSGQSGKLLSSDGVNVFWGTSAGASVSSFNTRTGAVTLTSTDVTTALGFTPSNSTGAVTSVNTRTGAVTINSTDVINALGYTPASSTGGVTSFNTRTGAVTLQQADVTALGFVVGGAAAGVSSFNTRTGAVTLSQADVTTALSTSTQSTIATTGQSNSSSVYLTRNASYSNGTPGYVNAALYAKTTVGSPSNRTQKAFEWGIVGVVDNYSDFGENVGGYFQGNRISGAGPIWGGVTEACDLSNADTTAGTSGTVGLEVDVWCNGYDNFERRIGIDIVVGNAQLTRNGLPGIRKGHAYEAIRIGPQSGDINIAEFTFGINILNGGGQNAGIVIQSNGQRGIWCKGNNTVGIECAGSYTDAAIRIPYNQYLAFDQFNTYKTKYNTSTGFLEFYNGATRHGYINITSGADVDLAGGSTGAYVDLSSNQTVGGIKTFSSAITASGGINTNIINATGITATGMNLSSGTYGLSSGGNLRSTVSSLNQYVRILIDGSPYYIPFYNA